jgi:ubiquitin-protein ligase
MARYDGLEHRQAQSHDSPKPIILTLNVLSQVDLAKLPSIANWKRDFTMETVLIEIRRYMAAPANKKLPQPPEGTNF